MDNDQEVKPFYMETMMHEISAIKVGPIANKCHASGRPYHFRRLTIELSEGHTYQLVLFTDTEGGLDVTFTG